VYHLPHKLCDAWPSIGYFRNPPRRSAHLKCAVLVSDGDDGPRVIKVLAAAQRSLRQNGVSVPIGPGL
jgi:hypothetical protein